MLEVCLTFVTNSTRTVTTDFFGDLQAPDGSWKYQGGNSYLETVPQTYVYSELIFRLSEKVQDAVAVKYQLPGEDLDPDSLISVCDDGDMQEMFDEYLRIIASPGMKDKGFRLRVFLFPAEEEIYVPEDLAVTSRRVSAADTFQLLQLQVKR